MGPGYETTIVMLISGPKIAYYSHKLINVMPSRAKEVIFHCQFFETE